MSTRARCFTSLALVALASLMVMVAQSTAQPSGTRFGCGILVDRTHPWHSHTPDAPVETGDHWIIARGGRVSTCAFTRTAVHKLLALRPATYENGHTDGHGHTDGLLGGLCNWGTGSRTERISPFQNIACLLPLYTHHHRYIVLVDAFVDPDPRFITR